MQQGHYWSYLRAEPFCPGFAVDFLFGGTARISDFLPRHISPTKIRHFGEALFRGGFFTRPIFHIGDIEEEKPGVWGIEWLWQILLWKGVGEDCGDGINIGSGDQSQGCVMWWGEGRLSQKYLPNANSILQHSCWDDFRKMNWHTWQPQFTCIIGYILNWTLHGWTWLGNQKTKSWPCNGVVGVDTLKGLKCWRWWWKFYERAANKGDKTNSRRPVLINHFSNLAFTRLHSGKH